MQQLGNAALTRGLRIALALHLIALWLLALPAQAANTTTLPKNVFILDAAWMDATTERAWDDARQPQSLLQGIQRYEPGGGLQGTITAQPKAQFRLLVPQILYGLTDDVTLALGMPVVTSIAIDPRLGWTPGVYQPSLGRPYSEDDFWQWAKSMGQKKPTSYMADAALADMVLGLRWRLPPIAFLDRAGVKAAAALQVALPTGKAADPEELVGAGTTLWDLHNYGDVEVHLGFDRPLTWGGVNRINFGADIYYSWLRAREMVSPTGSKNPLLLTHAPYIGEKWTLDPGDFLGFIGSVELVPLVGPTWSSFISGHKIERARGFPPLLTVSLAHNYVRVGQTRFESASKIWSWDREKIWKPGDKNTVRLGAELSLLRLGLPLQFYAGYRDQEWVPGRNTRAANILSFGARLMLRFW